MVPESDRRLLERQRPLLMGSIELSPLLAQLRRRGEITLQQQERIEAKTVTDEKVGELLNVLLRGDEDTVDKLIYSLRAAGQEKVAKDLLRKPINPDQFPDDNDDVGARAPQEECMAAKQIAKKGTKLTLAKETAAAPIEWKQGSLLGFGGDMKEWYRLCDYNYPGSDKKVPVYVHVGEGSPPQGLEINEKLQYGVSGGVRFFVLHDKAKFKPYQHRFVRTDFQKSVYLADNELSKIGYSAAWVAGDYLHDVSD